MADDERPDAEAGWAAPHLPSREPASDTTAPAAPPPASPPPPAAPPPPPTPSAAWSQPAPGGTPPAPTRAPRRRRAWLFALIGVLAAIAIALGLGTALFVSNTLPPYDAANDFVNDLADGKLGAAADQLCRADQENPQRAISVVTRHFPGNDRISVNPFGVDRDDDRATVDYTVTPRADKGAGATFELALREEDGDWKPCPGDTLR